MILFILFSKFAGTALGEDIGVIFVSFAFLMPFLWEDMLGRFALFAFKFVFREENGGKKGRW